MPKKSAKPKKPTKNEYVPHIPKEHAPVCEMPGCKEYGVYKAPRGKDKLHEYHWLCLEHIREYNQKWDFFKDMTPAEIEHFRSDAVTGHRPTWNRETLRREIPLDIYDALYEFLNPLHKRQKKAVPQVSAKVRKALSLLDLEYPYTLKDLKACYRALVKKHHPDVNKGNKLSEEKFKKITESYHLLVAHLKNS